mmetsp:Transcript_9480/g.30273  ORF Transcript_9480/g.30273 Transcript_9480/m.30273 type:complete len:372 (+) Transcript_9480:1043-2158(+)
MASHGRRRLRGRRVVLRLARSRARLVRGPRDGRPRGRRRPAEVAHQHGGRRALHLAHLGVGGARRQGRLRVLRRPRLFRTHQAVLLPERPRQGRLRDQPDRVRARGRPRLAGPPEGGRDADLARRAVPGRRASGVPELPGMGGLRARAPPGPGRAPGLAPRAGRRDRADHLRRPRGRHRQIGPARRPHLGARAALSEVGRAPPQGEQGQEGRGHHLPVPARQGQRRDRRLPGRLRLDPLGGQGAQAQGLLVARRARRHGRRGADGHGPQRQGGQVRLALPERPLPHARRRVPAAHALRLRARGELGTAAREPQLGRPEPRRLRRQARQRLHRRPADLWLRGRPDAPPLLEVGLAPPRLRRLLHLSREDLRG